MCKVLEALGWVLDRVRRALSDRAGGNLFKGLTLRAIVAANVGHIDQQFGRYGAMSEAPPRDLLRPVSVLAAMSRR